MLTFQYVQKNFKMLKKNLIHSNVITILLHLKFIHIKVT